MRRTTTERARAAALELELGMLEEGLAWADILTRADPESDAAQRARVVMPRLLARYERAERERRALSDVE